MLDRRLFSLNLADRTAIKNSFNPPTSFQPTVTNKYGMSNSQGIYNEYCTQGVELVIQTIQALKKDRTMISLDRVKSTLTQLLNDLARIRKNIAEETNSENKEYFGRSRKDSPVIDPSGKPILDISRIYNPQHIEAHNAVKSILKKYLPDTINNHEKQSYYQATLNDDPNNPNSRYVLTVYKQLKVQFSDKKKSRIFYEDVNDKNMENILRLAQSGRYYFQAVYACDPDISGVVADIAGEDPVKNIVVGEVQININGKFIPGTRHITWFNETISEFMANSRVCLQHMKSEYHEEILNAIAPLWLQAISWDEKKNTVADLNKIMADMQFYFGQSLIFYRGAPTIVKMLFDGTYYSTGFLSSQNKKPDAYCTAEYFPFMKQFRNKFIKDCFELPPGTKRTRDHELRKKEEDAAEVTRNYQP